MSEAPWPSAYWKIAMLAPISKAVSTMTNQMPDLALAGRASATSRAALCSAMSPLSSLVV